MTEVTLALGANLGDRLWALRTAVEHLTAQGWRVLRASPVFETPPFGYEDQPPFLNACVTMECPTDDPQEMLKTVKEVEAKMGRVERFRNGPREIDIDILFSGSTVYHGQDLDVPHRGIPQRAFVLVPLSHIEPNWVHPETGESVMGMLEKVDTRGIFNITNLLIG
ncbi:2-amino-4-hydroxy-6-hydroxymethyldihydropteridine diphosphokinase [Thermanaerovibrio acidaminovorans]|jgi:2-amino-4-hydroxy-6-hydroxymethyldihydropteridine diphosphokinase|uniref:2-amino-4-hydroxy-6- hydroxymethyldihydropteridine diphosphokinase n=1 Tax=Thermanaerovibrio acidaminovorans TaxID=81462 RepID=UPI002491701A|nr:2-amino-4-hydroxy-6-hydroxymethyldihydropteridine diphosphokinase [Thermanaerovibrio acidaminovorans]